MLVLHQENVPSFHCVSPRLPSVSIRTTQSDEELTKTHPADLCPSLRFISIEHSLIHSSSSLEALRGLFSLVLRVLHTYKPGNFSSPLQLVYHRDYELRSNWLLAPPPLTYSGLLSLSQIPISSSSLHQVSLYQ